MARIAIVGCEASGKTVFMSALTDFYPNLVPENSASNRFAAFAHRQLRMLRQCPALRLRMRYRPGRMRQPS